MRMPLLLLVMLPLAVGSAGRSRATDDSGPVQAVLDSIARDLTSNNRAALVARYDKRGAFFLGNWGAELVPFDSLRTQIYGSDWKPPVQFAWRNLHIEPLGPGSSIVYAQFLWRTATGDSSPECSSRMGGIGGFARSTSLLMWADSSVNSARSSSTAESAGRARRPRLAGQGRRS